MEAKKHSRRSGGSRGKSSSPKMRKSCNACAAAKRRCDGESSCSLCLKRDIACVYSQRQKSGPKGTKILDPCPSAGVMVEPNPATDPKPPQRSAAAPSKKVRTTKLPKKNRAPPTPLPFHQPAKKRIRRVEPPKPVAPTAPPAVGWQSARKVLTAPNPPTVKAKGAPERKALRVAGHPRARPIPVKNSRKKDVKDKASKSKAPPVTDGRAAVPVATAEPKIERRPPLKAKAPAASTACVLSPCLSPPASPPHALSPSLSPSASPPNGPVRAKVGNASPVASPRVASRSVGGPLGDFAPAIVDPADHSTPSPKTQEEAAEDDWVGVARRVSESESYNGEVKSRMLPPSLELNGSVEDMRWPDDDGSILDDIPNEDLLPFNLADFIDGLDDQQEIVRASGVTRGGGGLIGSHLAEGRVAKRFAGAGVHLDLRESNNGNVISHPHQHHGADVVVGPTTESVSSRVRCGMYAGAFSASQYPQQKRQWPLAPCSIPRPRSPTVVCRPSAHSKVSFRQQQEPHSNWQPVLTLDKNALWGRGQGQYRDAGGREAPSMINASQAAYDCGCSSGDLFDGETEADAQALALMVNAYESGQGGFGGNSKGVPWQEPRQQLQLRGVPSGRSNGNSVASAIGNVGMSATAIGAGSFLPSSVRQHNRHGVSQGISLHSSRDDARQSLNAIGVMMHRNYQVQQEQHHLVGSISGHIRNSDPPMNYDAATGLWGSKGSDRHTATV